MEEHCIKRLREEVTKKMREEQAMLKMAFPESATSTCSANTDEGRNGPLQAHAKFGRTSNGFDAHCYSNRSNPAPRTGKTGGQTGRRHNLPGRRLFGTTKGTVIKDGSKIVVNKTKVNNSTKRRFAVCKVVQSGDWSGLLDDEKVRLLPANKKCKVFKVLDVKPIERKGQKRKLVLTEDGTVYKVKRSEQENNVKAGQYV
jgi:hypothetical protein